MRVLLVNPEYPISETPSPPLALAVLAAALERAGVEVEVLDLVVQPYRESLLESVLERFAPLVVGLTCVTMTFHAAARVVRAVRRCAPDAVTVMGGPHVSFRAAPTLRQVPELDCVCRGEGEDTLVALARAAAAGAGFDGIPGLVWKRQGKPVDNGPRKAPVDIRASAAPARHLLPLGRYRALGLPVSMITSRGCPYSCIFCAGRRMSGGRLRYRDPHRVVDEMADLGRFGFHQINIADDLFTANHDHCRRVCRGIVRRGLSLSWACFARADTVSEEILFLMAEAGCHTLSFGVESADDGILKTARKGITTAQALAAVDACVKAGITPQVSFLLGLPGETPRTLERTVAFAGRLQQMGATFGFHLLAPFPGTDIRERAAAYGLSILSDDWRRYHANRAVTETESVTADMLDRIVVGWEQKFDEYLDHLSRLRRTGGAAPETVWPLTRLEHTVVIHDLMMARAIEERGVWRNGRGPVDPEKALAALIDRMPVPAASSYGPDQLAKSLRFAFAESHLRMETEDGTIRWRWVDTLT